MQTSIPSNITTGRVVGRFVVGVADGPDEDERPDVVPAQGRVTFTPTVPHIPSLDSSDGSMTILTTPTVAVLDENGFLVAPDQAAPGFEGRRGLLLIATDSPHILVQDWTYTVSYDFDPVNGVKPVLASHPLTLLTDAVRDLTEAVDVPSSPGLGTEQAEALVARAEAAATAAASVREDADAGLFAGAEGKKGDPGGFAQATNLTGAAAQLDDLLTPGLYCANDGADITLANNWPLVGVGGTLQVTQWSTQPGYIIQSFTARGGKTDGSIRHWVRSCNPAEWQPWSFFPATRTDQTAGRAIYMRNELTNREQLIYGDTGWRDIKADILEVTGITTDNARICRVGSEVFIAIILPSSAPYTTLTLKSFLSGFRGTAGSAGSRVITSRGGNTGVFLVSSTGAASIVQTGSAAGELNIFGSYRTTDPWPTTLPGTAVGTIPNL